MKNIRRVGSASALMVLGISTSMSQDQAPPVPAEKPKWERSAHIGATLTQGNSDTVLFTANALATKKWNVHELSLGADATYGEVDNAKNADSLHGFAQYNRLITERLYGYARADALHDAIADVDYRFTLGPGVGYYFIKRADEANKTATSLSGEAGPSFVMEKVGGVTSEYLALRLAEKFEHKFSDKARVWQMAEILPQVDDWENFIVNAEIGAEASLTGNVSLKVFVQDTYDNQPAPGRKRNDVKLVSALGYKF